MQREEILNEVLALPPADKSYIFRALEQSLMENADEQAFILELQRRMEAYRRNPQSGKPAADVLNGLRRRQADS